MFCDMIDQIIDFNKNFVAQKGYEKYLTDKYPDKKLAVLSCMDTRLTELLPAALGLKNDQGDRSLISYFERGREFGVRATSVFSCAINPLKILPYFIYDSIGQSADTNHLTWTCSKFTHHVTDYIFLSILSVSVVAGTGTWV